MGRCLYCTREFESGGTTCRHCGSELSEATIVKSVWEEDWQEFIDEYTTADVRSRRKLWRSLNPAQKCYVIGELNLDPPPEPKTYLGLRAASLIFIAVILILVGACLLILF